MLTRIDQIRFFVIILALLGFMAPNASALKLTLSDEGLMLLDEYSKYNSGLKATILETRDVEGPGVEFDIYFPGNKHPDSSIYYVFSKEKLKEVFQGIDVAAYDAFELKFTLISVDGSDSPGNKGILIVGAKINGAYKPESVSLGKNRPETVISITRINTDSISKAGFTAHMLTSQGWSPNGTAVTLLVEPVPDAISMPQVKESVKAEPKDKIIYVDSNASGANNGLSWIDAFKYLQDGLGQALEGDEIWVAEGIYRPDQGKNKKKGNKAATFVLNKGVAVYGGFPSGGGTWEDRKRVSTTILSGDLRGNDAKDIAPKKLLSDPTRNDNSYRVVSASGTNFDTILDGFVITGGNAKGASQSSFPKGGGVYCKSGSLTLSNCVLRANSGTLGGAMYNLRFIRLMRRWSCAD